MLDVWPALPFVIQDYLGLEQDLDNIAALFEHSDRMCNIDLWGMHNSDRLEKIGAAMQGPFPELTYLHLRAYRDPVPVLPDSFLAGPAPRLRTLRLDHFLFPGLPKLLLSTTHLVYFSLRIPHSGQFSPETMSTALATLTSLESLDFEIQCSRRSHTDRASQRPPPQTRPVLPVLTFLSIKGESNYLEDLVLRIDAPQLGRLYITFFHQIAYDVPQLAQFICRTPRLKAFEKACVTVKFGEAGIKLSSQTPGHQELRVGISSMQLDRNLSCLVLCISSLLSFSTLEALYIHDTLSSQTDWYRNIENTQLVELLHPFTAVKDFYISKPFAVRIVPALQELVGSRTTEVLPTLQNIFLEGLRPSGLVHEGIQQFISARQVVNHPITVTRWERDEEDGGR